MQKIPKTTAVLMVLLAVSVDVLGFLIGLLHFIPVLGNIIAAVVIWIMSLIAVFVFYIWLKMKNVSFVSAKRVLSFFGSFFGEMIPVIDAFPLWTTGIALTIGSVWMEEALEQITGMKVSINAMASGGVKNKAGADAGTQRLGEPSLERAGIDEKTVRSADAVQSKIPPTA